MQSEPSTRSASAATTPSCSRPSLEQARIIAAADQIIAPRVTGAVTFAERWEQAIAKPPSAAYRAMGRLMQSK